VHAENISCTFITGNKCK